jgi:hypothetical protein
MTIPFLLKVTTFCYFLAQWKSLNVMTDNFIIWLIWSICPKLNKSQITNNWVLCISTRLLIVIIHLMLSLSLCPKVITLSSFHCISQLRLYNVKSLAIKTMVQYIFLLITITSYTLQKIFFKENGNLWPSNEYLLQWKL